jgi:Phosphotransferase System HPr (HPr) Family
MKSFRYVIKEELGIHARPAGLLSKEAKLYTSDIFILAYGKSADVKKLIALMSLAVKKGTEVEFTISGPDEDAAMEKIKEFVTRNL